MEEKIQYIGETLWPGQLGHIFVILAFVSILFSVFSYWRNTKNLDSPSAAGWKKMGRIGFILHVISTFGIIGILFYVMTNLMYEYAYVYDHCSDDLPMRYIFSAFWEGQEGSFLLWMFWHCVLGLVIMKTGKKWEAPVLMFVGIIEAIIASMLLGIHIEIGDWVYKVGSNPTLLLRDVFDIPIFQRADYLSSVKGDGLNPLLQNYWMTIHPPTLFLGFAACTIPFAYAAAGFYMKEYKSWLKPGLKWGLFASAILGIGILMGAAWAYEALTFGGYWAWDPVENMSLVPWIVLIAGLHTNLIANSTGRAIKSTFIYYSLGFILVLYSTYLTRSGILGDTSAHAFTEMGLEPQLIFLVLGSAFIPLFLYIRRSKFVPVIEKEESIYSREFWMFVGALVLLFSGTIIAASTSLPVINAIIQIFNP
ncbi:MAG: cytochrome c biogenesis protein CcsA, partial [Bacteroidia bacterium]|nr:cytochrome c biogenesis protein CcsA [Bacteroidia bacterium]